MHRSVQSSLRLYIVVKLLSCVQLFCNPMDCSPPVSSVCGILQARILEWVVIPFSRGSSQPRDRTQVSWIAGGFFTIWAPRKVCGKPKIIYIDTEILNFSPWIVFPNMCVCIGENLDREEIAHLCASPPLPYRHQSLMGHWEPGALMPDTAGNWGIWSQVTGRSCSPKPVGCQELKRRKVLIKDD